MEKKLTNEAIYDSKLRCTFAAAIVYVEIHYVVELPFSQE